MIAIYNSDVFNLRKLKCSRCSTANFSTARFAAWVVCHLSTRVVRNLSARVGFEIGSSVGYLITRQEEPDGLLINLHHTHQLSVQS